MTQLIFQTVKIMRVSICVRFSTKHIRMPRLVTTERFLLSLIIITKSFKRTNHTMSVDVTIPPSHQFFFSLVSCSHPHSLIISVVFSNTTFRGIFPNPVELQTIKNVTISVWIARNWLIVFKSHARKNWLRWRTLCWRRLCKTDWMRFCVHNFSGAQMNACSVFNKMLVHSCSLDWQNIMTTLINTILNKRT